MQITEDTVWLNATLYSVMNRNPVFSFVFQEIKNWCFKNQQIIVSDIWLHEEAYADAHRRSS